MPAPELASVIVDSIASHATRGLIYAESSGMSDVVMHGRVNMVAVAEELLSACRGRSRQPNRSWAGWFACKAHKLRQLSRREAQRAELVAQLEKGLTDGQAAIVRMRLRDLERS